MDYTCNIEFYSTPVTKAIETEFGSMKTKAANCLARIAPNGVLDEKLIDWYKKKYRREPNLEAKDAKTVAKRFIEYYEENYWHVDDMSELETSTDYYSIADVEKGKEHVADIVLDIYQDLQDNVIVSENVDTNFLAKEIRIRWNEKLFERIAKKQGVSIADVREEFNNLNEKTVVLNWLREQLKEDFGIIDTNLLAVWCDLNSDTSLKYIKEILTNSKIVGLFNEDNISDDDKVDSLQLNTVEGNNTTSDGIEQSGITDDVDKFLTQANSHLGDVVNFTKHLTPRVRNYFNSLRKLASPNPIKTGITTEWSYDINNTYGIPETMTAEECAKMLYSQGVNFTNIESMIEHINKLGHSVRGFESFAKVAEDLRNDIELALQLFTVFAKTRVSKITVVRNNVAGNLQNTVQESNSDSDKDTAMMYDLRNSAKFSIINVEHELYTNTISRFTHKSDKSDELSKLLDNYKKAKTNKEKQACEKTLQSAIRTVSDITRVYFNSLSESAIENFIEQANNANGEFETKVSNLELIIKELAIINVQAIQSKKIYKGLQAQADLARQHNNDLRAAGAITTKEDFENISNILSEPFITEGFESSMRRIKNLFVNFSSIELNFNSTNANNKMASDILNNSTITRLIKILENGDNSIVERWGTDKLRSHHYKFSTLFLEKRKGNSIERYGIFRETSKGLKVTEYAKDVLKLSLFDGSKNNDTGKSSTYSGMNSGDFMPTVYAAFFNTESPYNRKSIPLASYFLRTPSDAPKTFVMRAPRYDTSDLYSYANKNDVDKFVNKVINNISEIDRSFVYAGVLKNEVDKTPLTLNTLSDILNHKKLLAYNPNISQERGGEHYTTIKVLTSNGYVLLGVKGKLTDRGSKQFLSNVSIINFAEYVYDKHYGDTRYIRKMPKEIQDVIANNVKWHLDRGHHEINGVTYEDIPTRRINKFHPVFNMMQDKVRQELFNMLVAMHHIFEYDENGNLQTVIENGVRKPVIKKGLDIDSLYDFYDKDKDGNLFKVEGNYAKLVGNVFNSNILTLFVDALDNEGNRTGTKHKKNYLMDVISYGDEEGKINLFYGGALSGVRAITKENANGESEVIDLEITPDAQSILDGAISNFIEDYINKAMSKIRENSDFISDKKDFNSVTEFAMNYRLFLMNCDELFEGNTKFYADAQTILKRAKEYQGSGIPYGIADYFEEDSAPKHEVTTLLSDSSILKDTRLEGLRCYNKFNAVTIKNSKDTNHAALKVLKEKLISLGVEEDDALNLLYGKVSRNDNGEIQYDDNGNIISRGGYTGTKVNDAQSYITFEEWVRRVAAKGQLKQYLPLIKRMLDAEKTGGPVAVADIKEFVQIQKNFYYDLYYDPIRKMEVPRQIKNAEIVLVPALIKGTQLETVYNLMKENNIDQLNTKEASKASNKNVLTLWDNDGNISEKNIQDFQNRVKQEGVVEEYNYKYLYTQQETPQHLNAKNKAGIQVLKKLIDNIPNEGHPLSSAKKDFIELMSENIYSSYKDLFDDLDIKYAEDGSIESMNKRIFFEKLREQLEIRGMDKNMYDCVDMIDEEHTRMPIIRNDIINTFESIIQAQFNNNITRQLLPGFHAAQGTNIGWRIGGQAKANKMTDEQLKADPEFQVWAEANRKKGVIIGKGKISQTVRNMFANYLDEQFKQSGLKISYDKDLHYHQQAETGEFVHYIEIKLPLSNFGIDKTKGRWKNMSDAEILKELQEEKLDEIIGYRIPTEGKQSMAIMKVVGFVPDAMGSTIIVPNDWVSQTGSDFDIDSVYGIHFNTYFDKEGKIHKVEFDKTKSPNHVDYYRYIKNSIMDKDLSPNTRTELKNARNKVKKEFEEIYNNCKKSYDKSYKAVEVLKDKFPKFVNTVYNRIENATQAAGDKKYNTGREFEIAKYINIKDTLEKLKDTIKDKPNNEERLQVLNNLITACDNFFNYFTNSDITEETAIERLDILEKEIQNANLPSFEAWSTLSPVRRASKEERDNGILDAMLAILKDDSTLEEQLSRSNFDDITEAINTMMPKTLKGERAARSPYDIFDQIAYQEDAMSGAALKAFSVSMDTFCSVCNQVRPMLKDGSEVFIVYDRGDIKHSDEVVDNFNVSDNAKIVDSKKGHFYVKHKSYGWSKNNKNIVGKILTSYSSQTTAHILDAIKEGAFPNVNAYTFGVYKTLANLGVDYKTIASFMMQEGVSRIVSAYNSGNSLFYDERSTPLEQVVRHIAKELKVKYNSYDSVSTVLRAINEKYNSEFNEVCGYDEKLSISIDDRNLRKLPIIASKLKDRLDEKGIFAISTLVEENIEDEELSLTKDKVNRLLFDLGVVLQFHKIQNIASEITGISTVCNPDKFGAGKSMYAANNFFNRIYKALYYTDTVEPKKKDAILQVDGQNMLEKVYPGCTAYGENTTLPRAERIRRGIQEGDERDSLYRILACHAKYGTAFSVAVGNHVIPTQTSEFVELINSLSQYISDNFGDDLPEDLYNDFQKYVLNYLYNNVPTIKFGWNFTVKDSKITDVSLSTEKEIEETQRIFGYNRSASVSTITINSAGVVTKEIPFTVKDKNNPTQDEINTFAQLSPGQKIKWIQSQSVDAGIFEHLEVDLFNPNAKGEYVGRHVIRFNDTGVSLNTIRAQYMNAVNSRNPFIKLAALDLVKYAVKVEGLRLGKSNGTKVIDNAVLYNNFGSTGYNFAGDVVAALNDLQSGVGILSTDTIGGICETYLRSKPDIKEIKTLKIGKTDYTIKKYNLTPITAGELKGLYVSEFTFNPNDKLDDEETEEAQYNRQLTKFRDKLVQAGIYKMDRVTRTYSANSYIKITDAKGNTRLYKIKDNGNVVIMYPLHALLSNETETWSANEEYNNDGYYSSEVYDTIINAILNEGYEYQRAQSIAVEIFNTKEFKNGKYVPRTDISSIVRPRSIELQKALNSDDARFIRFKDKIKSHFIDNNNNTSLYVVDSDIAPFISSENHEFIPEVSIKFATGERATFTISKPKETREAKKQLGDNLNNNNKKYVVKVDKRTASIPSTGVLSASIVEEDPIISNLVNINEKAIGFIQSQKAAFSNQEAVNRLEQLGVFNVTSRRESIANNTQFVTQQVSIFANKMYKDIEDRFYHFMPKPNTENEFYSVMDDEVQAALVDNQELQRKYFKLLNDIQAFKETFSEWDRATSKDDEIKSYISTIKYAFGKINKLPVHIADEKLIDNYITSLSTNPIVKDGLVKIMGGFYKTTGSMWAFHDIMENGNILVQTILKDVMGDIEAKRINVIKRKKEYRNKIKEIQQKAKEHGFNVDINNFITPDGRFVEDYTTEFVDKIDELRDIKDKKASEFGYGSIEFLTAKNDYDMFKAKYTHQEARPEYYLNKARAERKMIDEHPVLYSHYMTLYYEKLDLLNLSSEVGVSEVTAKRLSEIDEEMYNLRRPKYFVNSRGSFEERQSKNQPNLKMTQELQRELDLYSIESQYIMKEFVEAMARLNDKYFEYVPIAGFEQKLKKNLEIIAMFEKRNENGIPTVPQSILLQNEQYIAAKTWVKQNAYFEINTNYDDDNGNVSTLGSRVNSALSRLSMQGNGKFIKINEIIRKAENSRGNVRDERGIIDANQLTEEEINDIREEMRRKYEVGQAQPFTDRTLINSAPRHNEVYKPEFYDPMKTHGEENPRYYAVVTKINNILRKYYNELTDTIDFSKMDGSIDSINELNTLYNLMEQLKSIRKTVGGTNSKSAKEFIEENCEYDTNQSAFNTQFADISRRDTLFKEAWKKVNCEIDENGNVILDSNGRPIPNRMLYSVMVPKASVRDSYLDKVKTEDMQLLNDVYRTVTTSYYDQARAAAEQRARKDSSFSYGDWFMKNHIYNPYTHKMEPLPCWTRKEFKTELFEEDPTIGKWVPKASQREKKVRDGKINGLYVRSKDMRDGNYNKEFSTAENYRRGSGWDNNVNLNDYEKEMRDYLKQTLMQTATIDSAKRYFKRGFLPARQKQPGLSEGKTLLKEVGKLFGIGISTNNGIKEFFDEISYSKDVTPFMPLTKLIRTKDSILFTDKKPLRSDFPDTSDGASEYTRKLQEWNDKKKKVDEYNQKIHNDMLDKNWIDVIDDYLDLAGRYNAINENKVKLYYVLDKLRKQKAYIKSARKTEYDDQINEEGIKTGRKARRTNLKTDTRRGDKDNPVYDTAVDNELIKQYENFLRRLFFDQWKDQAGKLTKYANNLQGFVSANYMMLNVKGGIANVTLGKTGILAEAAAKEYFSYSDWKKAELEWTAGIISYGRALGKDFSYSVQDAIIKTMKVVDYDEHTGIVREAEYAKYSKKLRDAMFSPQTIGEHFMQNSVLFAMLHSHKLVEIPNDPLGIGVTYMNQAEYIRIKESENLAQMLDDTQLEKFQEYKDKIASDANELAEYAWFRKDALMRFVYLECTPEQRKKFKAERKKLRDKLINDFKALPDMRSQMELGDDGKLAFKEGSQLAILNSQTLSSGVTKSDKLLGDFTERVRLVNNKIHGVYNRLGSAYIEKTWIGSLIMQYHKHLPMGIMKRYASRGHYNETRGSIDKGMIWSVYDFFSLNFDKIKHDLKLTDDNVGALQSMQILFAHAFEYLSTLKTTWGMLTDYDKANIKRNIGDLTGVILACATAALLIMAGDDDDDDGYWYNLCLYEADRLASESFLYNPYGLAVEGKKLLSTPIAAQSIIGDAISTIGAIGGAIIEGEDYDPYYHTGRFAGEHKVSVYIQRRLPIWSQIRAIVDLPDNNSYYKVGQNPIGLFNIKDNK